MFPALDDPAGAVSGGSVIVDGRVVTNPASSVGPGSQIALTAPVQLRGEAKLRAALQAFPVSVKGRAALDLGAAAGGFTRVLLEFGARIVYAVDAGHGQLLGSLRQDSRVVNLEATNLGELDTRLIPEEIGVITLDLSLLSLSGAVPQLEHVSVADGADLIALVKPMFELRLPRPPTERHVLQEAVDTAIAGISAASWRVQEVIDSPVLGARGAVEFLIWAVR
jgi:23S rRNA (cytidine1920-2'-O)/16S rRNA (cytidine1409-2'-O)-methyltransferase